jgi:hypothetical protein
MSVSMVAASIGAAQLSCNSTTAKVRDRYRSLQSLPTQWRRALLAFNGDKQPVCPLTGRLLSDWPNAAPPSFNELLNAPAVGVRTGRLSGTLAFDFDGPEGWKTFKRLFDGHPWEVLPDSIAWSSGREGRRQVGFNINPEHFQLLENKRRKIDDLEIRWDNASSVICGRHPLTSGYKWIDGCEPWSIKLATLPLEVIEKIPDAKTATNKPTRIYKPTNFELTVPLVAFITYRSSLLVANGSNEGCCNDDALRLSIDLVAAENWLMAQKVDVDQTAQQLFDAYVENCPDRINGKPLNRQAMQARFDGAVRLDPTPPTPENKLFERLDFHRRQAARNLREVA